MLLSNVIIKLLNCILIAVSYKSCIILQTFPKYRWSSLFQWALGKILPIHSQIQPLMLDTDTEKKAIIKKFYKLYQKEPTRFPKQIQSVLHRNQNVTRKKSTRKQSDKKRRKRPKHITPRRSPPLKAKRKLRFTKEN